jgi:uncharacterized protein YyaL (SSP411 family)
MAPARENAAMNQLAAETSPYLLQHKDNPVDWHVWSQATLDKAKAANKPILLSIGYAACHWCHVMAHESFENAETAALMNELFVPVKVDREERPDLDTIYQNALGLLGQSGGWPLTMFLTPDGEPYWGGTYYPPESKYGRPAFKDVLKRCCDVYHQKKETVEKNTQILRNGLLKLSEPPPDNMFSPDTLDEVAVKLNEYMDTVDGGLGQAPKFPQSSVLCMLWRAYKRNGNPKLRGSVLLTLDRMSQGGIYDHLGGGYARYSTDNAWLVPHFEKMLYDNAQLVELLTWAWQETKNPLYRMRIAESIGWMLREMRVDGGGFAAALDADSEHEEGKFYVWTATEVEQVLGADAPLFKKHYDVHWIGNWENKTILNRSEKPELMDDETEARLAACRKLLFEAREPRVRPGRDHKVLADWNGLAISAIAFASSVFDNAEWLDAAKEAFAFVRKRMTAEDGRLFHSWCDGRTHGGTLDDYATMCKAALMLFQVTGDEQYFLAAETWVDLLNAHFRDTERGGYFFTPADAPNLIVRIRNAFDHATPSGNGVMLEVLAAMYVLTGNARYRDLADDVLGAFVGEAVRNSIPLAAFLSGADFLLNNVQIVIKAGRGTEAMRAALAGSCVPNRVVTTLAEGAESPKGHPTYGKTAIDGQATAYVCVGQSCSLPITDPEGLRTALSSLSRPQTDGSRSV